MKTYSLLTITAALTTIAVILSACRFDTSGIPSIPPDSDDIPVADIKESDRELVYEDPGNFAVFHGFSCAESNKSGTESELRVQESLVLPDYATAATVFLNGWQVKYLSRDHELEGLGSVIFNIELNSNQLNWDAGGILSDKNFDDAYGWCYYYTIPVWNEATVNAAVSHIDEGNTFYDLDDNHTTALKASPAFIENERFLEGGSVAILPRGFGLNFYGDRHLLQLAYNLDYSESFIQAGKTYSGNRPDPPLSESLVNSGFVSWDTKTILKDNSLRRKYSMGEVVSALSGPDVRVIQPPFTILPTEDSSGLSTGCIGAPAGAKTETSVVENVPFEYAVPLLTGWNIFYFCDDEHVAELGTWIPEFSYERRPDRPTGTLSYSVTSILRDKDSNPGHLSSNRVSILGFKPVSGEGRPAVTILSPSPNDVLSPDTPVVLRGEASDLEDGVLSGEQLRWVSDRDGFLGTGTPLQVRLSGPEQICEPELVVHNISLIATDSEGNATTQTVKVNVGQIC